MRALLRRPATPAGELLDSELRLDPASVLLFPGGAAAAEGIARQPSAADKITGAVNLPLFLLEGVAILAEVFTFLVLIMGK